MAENSTVFKLTMFAMDGLNLMLFILITTVIVCIFFLNKSLTLAFKNWIKNNSSTVFPTYKYDQMCNYKPIRLSLSESVDWQYRGEGNEYLAISLPERKQILRLRKYQYPTGLLAYIKDLYCQYIIPNFTAESKAAGFERLNLKYYKVLVNLIGECYVQPAENILLLRTEVSKINQMISSKRPEHRKKKRIGFPCGSLLTDYAYLPSKWDESLFEGATFAVELKPKQGWIPEDERLYQLCTYCHNQYIKLQNGETSGISEYCPMDLFSGNKLRMKHAIKGLLKTPQNNLKLFQDGVLAHGEGSVQKIEHVLCNLFATSEEKSVEEFCDIIIEALLKQLYNDNFHKCIKQNHVIKNNNYDFYVNNGHGLRKTCNYKNQELPSGCVLDRILKLQKLDVWGANNILEILKIHKSPRISAYSHAACVVARSAETKIRSDCAKCFFAVRKNENQDQLKIQQYLMSAIAKDCSLMLTFRILKNSSVSLFPKENIISTEINKYAFNIGVFDLYPKPMTSIYKHARKRDCFKDVYKRIVNENYSIKNCNVNLCDS